MKCAEADALVHAYVDGELLGVDRDEYERHVLGCAACLRASRTEARFKAAVRAHLPRPSVPDSLRERLQAALATAGEPGGHGAAEVADELQARRARRRPQWLEPRRLLPAFAAAAALLLITVSVRSRHNPVLDTARWTYQAEMPMDVAGPDCASVASWFRGRLGFPVHAPSLGGQVACQGGRLVNVRERPAAYLVYQNRDGHRVTFLVFDPRDESLGGPRRRMVNGREIFLGSGPGVSTAVYQDRGLGYAVTADVDEDTLEKLVGSILR